MKRILSVILCLVCLCTAFSISATAAEAVENILANGDMENGKEGWSISGTASKWDQTIFMNEEVVHGGKKSVELIADNTQIILLQKLPVQAGTSYTVEGWFQTTTDTARGVVKLSFLDASGKSVAEAKQYGAGTSMGEWKKFSKSYTMPEGTAILYVMYRASGAGSVYWDDMQVRGIKVDQEKQAETQEKTPPPEYPVFEAVEGTGNLLVNEGFEELNEKGMPKDWSFKNAETCLLETEIVHSGKNAVKITAKEAFFRQEVAVKPNTKYQISAWAMYKGTGSGAAFKLEYYGNTGSSTGYMYESGQTERFKYGDDWFRYVQQITTPAGCDRMQVYPRLKSAGIVYFDDLEVIQIEETPRLDLRTDEIFYYSEWETGYATATATYPEDADKYVKFRIKDGDAVLSESTLMPIGGHVSGCHAPDITAPRYIFPISVLEEYMKEYTMEAQLCEADGTVLTSTATDIYRSSRPSMLDEDGTVRIDGEVFVPSIAYHPTSYPNLTTWGINVIQASPMNSVEAAIKKLDSCEKYGVKALLQLYVSMNPAGSAVNAENTRAVVEAVKDHPAVFGYMQMDEPGDQSCDYEALKNGYKIIRSLDTVHPVYACECRPEHYALTGKYVDVMSIDPYPSYPDKVTTDTFVETKAANEALGYKKPLYVITQAFDYKELAPTYDDMRTQIYQSIFASGMGPGYFALDSMRGTKPVTVTEMYEAIADYVVSDADILYRHFYGNEGVMFNEYNGADIRYRIWADGTDFYAMVLDVDTTDKTISIPLTSFDGEISIGAFTATPVSIKDAESFKGNGTLSYPLAARQSILFKITPDKKVDVSSLPVPKYRDLLGYNWARKEITALSEKGIVNDVTAVSFAPGKNITRGDLAYFLVRTLGLTAEATENFADVSPHKYYAKEIAEGKALGVLNGIGDNKFNPEAEITRQDLMTIISRGMQLSGAETDVSVFPDAGNISDYALSHVKAMIGAGLIKGNADGTLNPLGQATRAEAAVIMYRILANQ